MYRLGVSILLAALLAASGVWAAMSGPGEWEWSDSPDAVQWQKNAEAQPDAKCWDGVLADRKDGTVRVLAEAAGIATGIEAEFLLIGKKSDRGYESLFVAKNAGDDICRAMAWLGVTPGAAVNWAALRFWPRGEHVSVMVRWLDEEKPLPITEWIKDIRESDGILTNGFAWVAGEGWDASKMPASIVSFFNEEQTVFDLPVRASKGAVYGRFRVAQKLKEGRKAEFIFRVIPTADGEPRVLTLEQPVKAGMSAADIVKALRPRVKSGHDVFVRLKPDDDVTARQMKELAQVLALLEGNADGSIRLDAPTAKDFYLPAFAPSDEWRVRRERPFQPWEFHLGESNCLIHVEEDWSGEGLDPKLTPKSYPLAAPEDILTIARTIDSVDRPMRTALVFVPPGYTLGQLRRWLDPVRERLPQVWIFIQEGTP